MRLKIKAVRLLVIVSILLGISIVANWWMGSQIKEMNETIKIQSAALEVLMERENALKQIIAEMVKKGEKIEI